MYKGKDDLPTAAMRKGVMKSKTDTPMQIDEACDCYAKARKAEHTANGQFAKGRSMPRTTK